ncbi:site-specific DNA-methyltransferase [Microvirga yunnanensis]|uniref:site-specific DNA-methyltransferase n=1 Tax=Microvirga yunnanensis TaxID=2953740 RepID=UPI0021C618EE|nr:DNA methyltransferase [Microvirga sp. HBU65207]
MSELTAISAPALTLGAAAPPSSRKVKALHRDLKLAVEYVPIDSLKAYKRALRTHSPAHIEQLEASIQAFGFVQPILVDADGEIVGGHGIFEAARKAGYRSAPVVRLTHLDDAQKRTLRIALNRLAEKSGWNQELLALEFKELLELDLTLDLDFDFTITGFASPEIDQLIERQEQVSNADPDEFLPDNVGGSPVSRLGDLWLLGEHRLICGDARDEATYARLLGDERAAMGIHDAPYDVPISGHVAKPGRHKEFIMGAGELGEAFTPFLSAFLQASSGFLTPGGYQFCFMDWRHMGEMLTAGHAASLELKNLCVWNKGSGAMGSLYRSQHELVFVFKDPESPGANHVQLGRFGRNRTNVWDYPGAASLRKELELHPTPKNVRMIADAIRDVTSRNAIVLDAFSGSGTTIIACAKVGRRGYAVELDVHYVDVSVRRWEQWSGKIARHAETGLTFAEMAALREAASDPQASHELDLISEPAPTARVRKRSPRVL